MRTAPADFNHAKAKILRVWKGRKPGIFTSWAECEKQVKGFAAAQFKAFESLKEAESAYQSKYEAFKGKPSSLGKWKEASVKPILPSICVDAACNGSPGKLEYRGVFTESAEEIFRVGPFPDGTNNVGEFLAIVHALTWMAKHEKQCPFILILKMGFPGCIQANARRNSSIPHGMRRSLS